MAIYAAAFCDQAVQERIVAIYNNDGPGFLEDVIASNGYQAICDRIQTYVPQTSFFGLALEHAEEYTVIESTEHFLMQHDPYSWMVDRIDFVYAEEMDARHRILDESLSEWVMSLPKEEVESFVNALYQIVEASEAADLISFTKNWTKSLAGMAGAIQNLDEETKKSIHRVMKSLANVSREKIRMETGNYLHNKIEGLTNQFIGKEGM